jgi:hypothetical protein
MRLITVFILLLAVLLISSCMLKPKPKGDEYQCIDGRIVLNLSECNTTLPPPPPRVNITQEEQNQPPAGKTDPRNFSTLRKKEKQENTTKNTTGTSLPKLNGWSVPEIVEGLGSYNPRFSGAFFSPITYTDDKNYVLGQTGPRTYDPFAVTRKPYAGGGVREYSVNHLRVYLTQTPYEFYDMVEAKHGDSKFKIVYPDQWAEWASINCTKVSSCRNIEAVECIRMDDNGEHHLYMWTHNTPGSSYTELTKYNMQAFDDKRETLTTFEEFYCTPI